MKWLMRAAICLWYVGFLAMMAFTLWEGREYMGGWVLGTVLWVGLIGSAVLMFPPIISIVWGITGEERDG